MQNEKYYKIIVSVKYNCKCQIFVDNFIFDIKFSKQSSILERFYYTTKQFFRKKTWK